VRGAGAPIGAAAPRRELLFHAAPGWRRRPPVAGSGGAGRCGAVQGSLQRFGVGGSRAAGAAARFAPCRLLPAIATAQRARALRRCTADADPGQDWEDSSAAAGGTSRSPRLLLRRSTRREGGGVVWGGDWLFSLIRTRGGQRWPRAAAQTKRAGGCQSPAVAHIMPALHSDAGPVAESVSTECSGTPGLKQLDLVPVCHLVVAA